MKRPVRPFVVEVKKKRGKPAVQRSIWSGVDLAAIAAEPAIAAQDEVKEAPRPALVDPAPPAKLLEEPKTLHEVPTSSEIAPNDDDGHDTVAQADVTRDDTSPSAPARRLRKRMSKGSAKPLARGERWKRRLPKALRR